ncbi:hypothetical protein [Candidatus Coxiella mudrowiae]|uniref:hypothetical protein n=1 Tax=Candidatus Coxiella mudrowiae TaxID=2054173 RepID=UPI001FD006E0|nr:hypothetical protein [Candidatus Coxiella mudrowiae]
MIAERSNYRQQLENQLTQDSIFVMLITHHTNYLPFSRIFNLDYRRSKLKYIKKVTYEVRHHAPSYLEPLDLEAVPSEIKLLVSELKNLFGRLKQDFERKKTLYH